MIDRDLIDSLGKDSKIIAETGLKQLFHSGVLELQKQRLLEQLTSGSVNEPDEDLVKRVRVYRQNFISILSLQELAKQLSEED